MKTFIYSLFVENFQGAKHTKSVLYFFTILTITLSGCSKKTDSADIYSYEVDCESCDISYTDKSNTQKTVTNHKGKWNYDFNRQVNFDLRITVRNTSLIKPQIYVYVYVLKNGEVVFGDNGNNYADITYSTKNARGTGYNGTYQNSGTGTGSNTGGSYTPASSVCGARTKSGGSCKRLVSGGGRCWQHR